MIHRLLKITEIHRKVRNDQKVAMIAMIIRGGNVIAIGKNNYHRLSFPYRTQDNYSKFSGIHAEKDAIRKCTKEQLKNSSIIIFGMNVSSGNIVKSKPCKSCLSAIKSVNIKKIIYFDKTLTKHTETL